MRGQNNRTLRPSGSTFRWIVQGTAICVAIFAAATLLAADSRPPSTRAQTVRGQSVRAQSPRAQTARKAAVSSARPPKPVENETSNEKNELLELKQRLERTERVLQQMQRQQSSGGTANHRRRVGKGLIRQVAADDTEDVASDSEFEAENAPQDEETPRDGVLADDMPFDLPPEEIFDESRNGDYDRLNGNGWRSAGAHGADTHSLGADAAEMLPTSAEAFSSAAGHSTSPITDPAWGAPAGQSAAAAAMPAPFKSMVPKFEIGGVVQADSGWYSQDDASREAFGDIQDGAGIRRARLSAKGKVAENMNGFVQFDFGVFGRPTFTDLWLEVTDVPVLGNVRIGQWKMPYGLEVVTSFRYQTFLERSVLFTSFDVFRHVAIGFYNNSEDLNTTWAASVYRNGNDQYGNDIGDTNGVNGVGRITHLMYYDAENNGDRYLHVGGAYALINPTNRRQRLATAPESFVSAVGANPLVGTTRVSTFGPTNGTPPFADTGFFGADQQNNFATEFLLVEGPLSFQAEAQWAHVSPTTGGGVTFPGAYGQVSYFLTGEHRPYDRKAGALDRVKPKNDFITLKDGSRNGPGAWEIASRLSHIDLNRGAINGGRFTNWTVGVNWYMNPYAKLQWNYIRTFSDNTPFGDARTDFYGMRMQFDF